jgi:hypothetical protein
MVIPGLLKLLKVASGFTVQVWLIGTLASWASLLITRAGDLVH